MVDAEVQGSDDREPWIIVDDHQVICTIKMKISDPSFPMALFEDRVALLAALFVLAGASAMLFLMICF